MDTEQGAVCHGQGKKLRAQFKVGAESDPPFLTENKLAVTSWGCLGWGCREEITLSRERARSTLWGQSGAEGDGGWV